MAIEILTVDRIIEGVLKGDSHSRDFGGMKATPKFDLTEHPRYHAFRRYLVNQRREGRLQTNPVHLDGCDFSRVMAKGFYLPECRAAGANFADSIFPSSNLGGFYCPGADLSNADFRWSVLDNWYLGKDTKIDGIRLYGSSVDGVFCSDEQRDLIDASLNSADSEGHIFPCEDFHMALIGNFLEQERTNQSDGRTGGKFIDPKGYTLRPTSDNPDDFETHPLFVQLRDSLRARSRV
jgi:hypothetical protein